MQFTFDYYDIQKALELLVKDKLGVSLDLEDVSHADYPSIEYNKSEHVTKHLEFDDSAELTIYVSGERE
jgi:hypothetical protein